MEDYELRRLTGRRDGDPVPTTEEVIDHIVRKPWCHCRADEGGDPKIEISKYKDSWRAVFNGGSTMVSSGFPRGTLMDALGDLLLNTGDELGDVYGQTEAEARRISLVVSKSTGAMCYCYHDPKRGWVVSRRGPEVKAPK